MSVPRRFVASVVILSLLAALAAAASAAAATPGGPGAAASKKKHRKKCPKGYKAKVVNKHHKKVRKCVKRRKPGPGQGKTNPSPTPPTPAPGPFEAPGQRLEGEAAKPFLQKYLVNSTFTDCPAAWPNCAVEERYSHTSDSFYYCRLTSSPGSDIINGARAYQVQNAVVEADGSWTFDEVVDNYGNPSRYEWHVATDGTVTGAYQYNGVEQIGPLQYVSGARDCSY